MAIILSGNSSVLIVSICSIIPFILYKSLKLFLSTNWYIIGVKWLVDNLPNTILYKSWLNLLFCYELKIFY